MIRRSRIGPGIAAAALLLFAGALGLAPAEALAQNFDSVQIRTIPVRGGVYMLMGSGGNIGLSVGEDGAVVIDDEYAPLSEKILAAVRKVTPEPVRFVINTHWHGDHTGGNENMHDAGATLVAQENVRKRLEVDQVISLAGRVDSVPASPEGALPVITFTEVIDFHMNGDDLHVFHVEHAHTDGDAIILYRNANVVHMGDTYFNGSYPFIDRSSGGSIDGVIAAAGKALALMDADTKVIPGHGPLSDREGVRAYRDMLKEIRDAVAAQIRAGKTLEQVKAAHPSADYDQALGKGFISPDILVEGIYADLWEAGVRPGGR